MSDLYFTAREIADMALTDFPATRQGIFKKATAEDWPFIERQGRGGGRLYPLSHFAAETRAEILAKRTGSEAPAGMYVPQADKIDKGQRATNLRGDAKWYICRQFNKFTDHHVLSIKQAEPLFINQYDLEKQSQQYVWFADWIFDSVPEFSVQSLRRWRSLAQQPGKMKPRYGNRKGTGIIERAEEGLLCEYIAAILIKQEHLNAGHIRDLCRSKFGNTVTVKDQKTGAEKAVPLPKIRAFERHIVAWKFENADIYLKLTNPDSHKNRKQLALGNASARAMRLNQLWEIDASPADIICDDGRYSLYAILDVWSRRALFSVSKTPRTEASLLLIRRAILEWGVPEIIKTDNGSDFVSKHFMTALVHLGIEQETCTAYTPEQKPHVERVIQTIQHGLMPLLPGYIGHSVSDAQQIRAKKAFSARLGEGDKKSFSVSLTHEQLQEYMDRWANDKYAHKKHSTIGMTPFARAASWTLPIKRIENVRALDLMLAPMAGGDGFRTIGKKGLRINNGHFYGPGIELYVGKRVMVRHDPEDMGRVYVFTEDHEFICEATNIDRLGADPVRAASEAKARQKQMITEGTKELRRAAREITPELVSEQYLSLAAKDAGKITAFPKQSESYTNAALDEAARAITNNDFSIHEFKKQDSPVNTVQSDHDRWWDKAMHLEALQELGEILDTDSAKWLVRAQETGWYKARLHREELIAEIDGV